MCHAYCNEQRLVARQPDVHLAQVDARRRYPCSVDACKDEGGTGAPAVTMAGTSSRTRPTPRIRSRASRSPYAGTSGGVARALVWSGARVMLRAACQRAAGEETSSIGALHHHLRDGQRESPTGPVGLCRVLATRRGAEALLVALSCSSSFARDRRRSPGASTASRAAASCFSAALTSRSRSWCSALALRSATSRRWRSAAMRFASASARRFSSRSRSMRRRARPRGGRVRARSALASSCWCPCSCSWAARASRAAGFAGSCGRAGGSLEIPKAAKPGGSRSSASAPGGSGAKPPVDGECGQRRGHAAQRRLGRRVARIRRGSSTLARAACAIASRWAALARRSPVRSVSAVASRSSKASRACQ